MALLDDPADVRELYRRLPTLGESDTKEFLLGLGLRNATRYDSLPAGTPVLWAVQSELNFHYMDEDRYAGQPSLVRIDDLAQFVKGTLTGLLCWQGNTTYYGIPQDGGKPVLMRNTPVQGRIARNAMVENVFPLGEPLAAQDRKLSGEIDRLFPKVDAPYRRETDLPACLR